MRETAPPAPDSGPRILYVDDDAALLDAFSRSLAERGFRVDAVATPREALRFAARCAYAVIVSELQLPDCDGLALVAELRGLLPHAGLVLAGTSDAAPLGANPVLAGAGWLRKPWSEAELGHAVSNAYEQHRLQVETPLPAAVERWSVLLVEPSPEDAKRLTIALKRCGACGDVAHCSSVSSALALLTAQTFDAVLAAITTSEPAAIELVRRIQEAASDAALIVLTSAPGAGDSALLELGVQAHLSKATFDPYALRRHLQAALAEKRLERGF